MYQGNKQFVIHTSKNSLTLLHDVSSNKLRLKSPNKYTDLFSVFIVRKRLSIDSTKGWTAGLVGDIKHQ